MSHGAKAIIGLAVFVGLVCFGIFLQVRKMPAPGPYEVVCVSGGIPVLRFTAQQIDQADDGWRFVSDGIEYRTNLECIARPSP